MAPDGRPALANRLVVGFREGIDAGAQADVHRRARRAGARAAIVAPVGPRAHLVDVTGLAPAAALQAYLADTRVAYAEPDYVAQAAALPDDPRLAEQWALATIQAPAAWDHVAGAPPVTVAVLDSGIHESHPDLAGRVVDRRDFTSVPYRDSAPDGLNHGTRVAGIVGAMPGNGLGIAGVAHDVRLLNGRVLLNDNRAVQSAIAPAIRWAVEQGARVINLSVAVQGACPQAVQAAIDDAWDRDVLVVVAAGNHGLTVPYWPADCRHAVGVAGTTRQDGRVPDSNYGAWVTLAAPGEAILSTDNAGGYGTAKGTSYAAPHVAGVAALVLATCGPLGAQAVLDRIAAGADPLPPAPNWGIRRVNAARAVCPREPAPHQPVPAIADADTLVLDHFDGATTGEAFGGPTYVPGQSGLDRAVSLSPGRYIRYDLDGWYDGGARGADAVTQGTVEFWVQYQVVGDLLNLNWNRTTSLPPAGHVLYAVVDPDGHPTYTTWNTERCCLAADLVSPMVLPTGRWLHLALAWGPGGSRLYVDGVVVASSPDNVYPAGPRYGYLNVWGITPTVALVDEFHVSRVRRTEAEIRRHAGLE
jgi:thermitase